MVYRFNSAVPLSPGGNVMGWYLRMRLGAKLILAFFIGSLITLVIGVWGLYNAQHIAQRGEEVYTNNLVAISDLAMVQKSLLLHSRSAVRMLTQERDPQGQAATIARLAGNWETHEKS